MSGKLLGCLFALICLGFIWLACLAAQAGATVGFSHGIGPHISSPTTISAGRLYYKPGDGHSAASDWLTTNNALNEALRATEHAPQKARKARCAMLHVEYVSRHGLATPTPLTGLTGCQKWATDSAYWRHRRNEAPNLPSGPVSQIAFQINLMFRQPAQELRGWWQF